MFYVLELDDLSTLTNLSTLTDLTNVSTIPEDSEEADTYYSKFDNEFEDEELEEEEDSCGSEESDEDYDDECDAFICHLEAALELGTQETFLEDEVVGDRFSQTMRKQKIDALRQYPFFSELSVSARRNGGLSALSFTAELQS